VEIKPNGRQTVFGLVFDKEAQTHHSVFMKLCLDFKHSTINRYFVSVVDYSDVFQIPQLHKHFNVGGQVHGDTLS
jgi:hypothetical protein